MMTTNLPTIAMPWFLANEKKNSHAHEHAAQPRDPQLAVTEGDQLLQCALHACRIEEGDHTLHDEKQREGGQQIRQAKCQSLGFPQKGEGEERPAKQSASDYLLPGS